MSGRFPNVDWWCDYCGALLNYQNGFDDSNDTWACTECGTINRISASEIYESHKDYRKESFGLTRKGNINARTFSKIRPSAGYVPADVV